MEKANVWKAILALVKANLNILTKEKCRELLKMTGAELQDKPLDTLQDAYFTLQNHVDMVKSTMGPTIEPEEIDDEPPKQFELDTMSDYS